MGEPFVQGIGIGLGIAIAVVVVAVLLVAALVGFLRYLERQEDKGDV